MMARPRGAWIFAAFLASAAVCSAPAFAGKDAPPPPQTFQLSPDGCSITSSNLVEQFKSPGLLKGFTMYDIAWKATWVSTGCKLPIYVEVGFDYLNSQREVVLTRYWDKAVTKAKFNPTGEIQEKMKTTVQIAFVRLAKMKLLTEAQYNEDMKR